MIYSKSVLGRLQLYTSFKITQRKFRLAPIQSKALCKGSWMSSCPRIPKISANKYLYVHIYFFLADNFQQIIRGIYNIPRPPPKRKKKSVNSYCFEVKTILNLYETKKVLKLNKYLSFKYDTVFAKCSAPPSGKSRNKRAHCSRWCHKLVRANFWKR